MITTRTKTSVPTVDRIEAFPAGSLGWIVAVWKVDQLAHLVFGHDTPDDALATLPLAKWDVEPRILASGGFAKRMRAYADGRRDDFRDIQVVPDGLTPFSLRVIANCREIEYGATLSYGQLAARAGAPRAARAVGAVMARNRVPLIVPCHRVIGATGSLHGFSARGGLSTKQRLLALESGG